MVTVTVVCVATVSMVTIPDMLISPLRDVRAATTAGASGVDLRACHE
jgi:hypothetical protein